MGKEVPLALCFHPQDRVQGAAPPSLKRLLEAGFNLALPCPPGTSCLSHRDVATRGENESQVSQAGSQSELCRSCESWGG